MSEGFSNPIVGGGETLIRSAIKSFNYATGVAGWRITRTGSAEFNDATIRGELIAGGGNISLNAGGLHIIGAGVQFDINGTAGWLARNLPDDGRFAQSTPDGFFVNAQDPSPVGSNVVESDWGISYENSGLANENLLTLYATAQYTGKSSPYMFGRSQKNNSATNDGNWDIVAGSFGDNSYISLQANTVDCSADFTIFNNDGGRGTVSTGGRAASSGAIGNVETDLYTCSAFTFKAGRAYQLDTTGMHTISVANNRPLYRLRKSSGGTQIVARSIGESVAGVQEDASWDGVFYVTGADVTCSPVVSVIGSAAFTVTVLGPYGTIIKDIGEAPRVSGWAFQLT